jgi:hypothetical protein
MTRLGVQNIETACLLAEREIRHPVLPRLHKEPNMALYADIYVEGCHVATVYGSAKHDPSVREIGGGSYVWLNNDWVTKNKDKGRVLRDWLTTLTEGRYVRD